MRAKLRLFSGVLFDVLDPDPALICIKDIAHSLSLQCRFNGHCLRYYSVAEHSVRVATLVPFSLFRTALLHDATEAYLSDLPTPIKDCMALYMKAEERLQAVIAARFNLVHPIPQEVCWADKATLRHEQLTIMVNAEADVPPLTPYDNQLSPLQCLSPTEAEAAFLRAYHSPASQLSS